MAHRPARPTTQEPVATRRPPPRGSASSRRAPPLPLVRRLRRDIALAIVVKLLLITALYLLFFAPDHRPATAPGDVAERLSPSGKSP